MQDPIIESESDESADKDYMPSAEESGSESSSSSDSSVAKAKRMRMRSWITMSTDSFGSALREAEKKLQMEDGEDGVPEENHVPSQHIRAFVENVMHKLQQLPPQKYHATCKKLDDILYEELMKEDEGAVCEIK